MSTNCIQCGTGTRNGPDLLCGECRGTEFVAVKQVIHALGDVYDWFQSDEENPKPILDIVREMAEYMEEGVRDEKRLKMAIESLLDICHAWLPGLKARVDAIAAKALFELSPLREDKP